MVTQAGRGGGLGDPRFFRHAGPFGLAAVLEAAGPAALSGPSRQDLVFTGIAPLDSAGPGDVTVLHNPRYASALERTQAGAVLVAPALAARVPTHTLAVVVANPHASWARVAALFHPFPAVRPGIHPSAVVDPEAQVDPSAEIGPLAVIGAGATIGPFCRIEAGAVVGPAVTMGEHCRIGPLASVTHAILGARVYVYPGARIGQEGFGFAITQAGFVTVPQLGRVILEDDVEIGANSAVDRGASQDTVIGRGTRIDNLVQIGHNARLGRSCVVVGLAGIAGSASLGDGVQIGAQVGVAGHVHVGAHSKVGAQAGVMSDLAEGVEVVGSPAMPIREFFRNVAVLRRLARRTPGGDPGDKRNMG